MKPDTVTASEKFDLLAEVYDNTPSQYYEQWDGDVLAEIMGKVSGKRILDIGCGTGRLLKRLEYNGADAEGIDVSEQMVKKACSKGLAAFHSDINVFQTDVPYDIIVSVLTLNYIQDKDAAFKKIHSLLNAKGEFVLVSDNQTQDTAVCKEDTAVAAPYFPLNRKKYKELLENSGFTINIIKDLYWTDQFRLNDSDESIGFIIKAVKRD